MDNNSKELEALFGTSKLFANDRIEKPDVIPTGDYLLDDALGCGGLPKGRIIQFYGPAASGKTLVAMLAIKQAQKEPNTTQLFLDLESTFDKHWAKTLGLDVSRIIVPDRPELVYGSILFKALWGAPKKDAKDPLDKSSAGLFDKIASKQLNINMVVMDSLGVIIPPAEASAEVGAIKMAPLPRFLAVELKKLSPDVTKANVPFIIINHVRESMDPYGPKYIFAGGNQYKHSMSMNILFEQVNRKDSFILDDNENKLGHTIRAKIEKNKLSPPHAPIEFQVEYSKGFVNFENEILTLSEIYNVISRPNNVMYEYNGKSWRGKQALLDDLKNNKELFDEMIAKIQEKRDRRFEAYSVIETSENEEDENDALTDMLNGVNLEGESEEEGKKKGKKKKV